jgi:hypothetical protein
MSAESWERWSRGFGMLFVVMVIVAFFIFGDQPKVDDSAASVMSFYGDHHGRIATATFLFILAFLVLTWFVAALTNALRASGEGRLANAAVILVAAFVGAQILVATIGVGLTIAIANGGITDELARTLNTMAWSADAMASIPLAGSILASTGGLTRAQLAPRWYAWVGGIAALVILARGTTLASDGFWSPSGEYAYATIVAALGWTFLTSLLLYRAEIEAPARSAAPTPA